MGKFNILVGDITSDEMKATATINPPSIGGADVTVEQIKKGQSTGCTKQHIPKC